jgi:hypothetical protein
MRPDARKEAWGERGEPRNGRGSENERVNEERERFTGEVRNGKENFLRQQMAAESAGARPRVPSKYCVRCRRETVLCSHVRPERETQSQVSRNRICFKRREFLPRGGLK